MLVQTLRQLNFDQFIPFQLNLHSHSIQCQEILRLVPGKRVVFKATSDGSKTIILKIFFSKNAQRHQQREIENYHLLKQNGINTPRLIFDAKQNGIYFLAFEYLNQDTLEPDFPLVEKIAQQIITLHQNKLIHTDCHLSNFLFSKQQCHVLDLSSIEKTSNTYHLLDNYALFLCQLSFIKTEQLNILMDKYCHIFLSQQSEKKNYLQNQLRRHQEIRNTNYLKKTLRTCTSFIGTKSFSHSSVVQRQLHNEWQSFLQSPEDFIQRHPTILLKNGRSSSVFKLTLNNKSYVIKRYNIKNILHFLKRFWRPTRACHSWQYANLLTLLGIHTPQPVLFYEKRFFGLRLNSYFISDYIDGRDLLSIESADQLTEEAALSTCNLLKKMWQQNIYHGDLKASNIVIHNNKAHLLDLDSIHLISYQQNNSQIAKDQNRFLRNWEHSNWLSFFTKHISP